MTVKSKPRQRRRWLRGLLYFSGSLVVLWTAFFLHATWSLNQAIAALKERGEPATFVEAVARNRMNDRPETGVGYLRLALAENDRVGAGAYSTYYLVTPFGGSPSPLDPEPRKAIEAGLQLGANLTELLEKAVALPPGPLTSPDAKIPGYGANFKESADSRLLAMYLAADARFSALTGDARQAFKRLKLLYLFTEQLSAEEFLLPQRVRIGLVSHANRAAKRVLSTTDLSADELTELAEVVVRIERNLKLFPALRNERAALASHFEATDSLSRELHNNAASRLEPARAANRFWTMTDSWWIDLVMSPLGTAARRRAASQTLRVPNEVLALADRPPPWPPESQRLFEIWSPMFSTDRISLNPTKEDDLYAATYIARRVRRELAMVELAFRLRRYELIHGTLPHRLEELVEPSFPNLPTKWFEGKPFVYSTKGRTFTIEANPDVKVEVPLPNDEHRDAWGVLLRIDFTPMTSPKS